MVSAGERMFVGTGNGSLTAHECRGDTTNALKAGSFECREVRGCNAQSLLLSISCARRSKPVLSGERNPQIVSTCTGTAGI